MTKIIGRAGVARLIALCALSTTLPAFAADDVVVSYGAAGAVTRSVAVPVDDLQLGTAAGRATLDNRIIVAARAACGYESVFGIAQPRDYRRCYAQTKSEARAQVARIQTASR